MELFVGGLLFLGGYVLGCMTGSSYQKDKAAVQAAMTGEINKVEAAIERVKKEL